MQQAEFLAEVVRLAAPGGMSPEQVAEVVKPEVVAANAGRIYDWLTEQGFESDSVSREAVFDYAAASLGLPYDAFYDAWLAEAPVAVPDQALFERMLAEGHDHAHAAAVAYGSTVRA